jgi:hypothetical protein
MHRRERRVLKASVEQKVIMALQGWRDSLVRWDSKVLWVLLVKKV